MVSVVYLCVVRNLFLQMKHALIIFAYSGFCLFYSCDFGFNARTEQYEKLIAAGVIDPTKVTRVALENAASIAGMLLTTECVIADKPKKEEASHAHGAPGMGGMDY